MKFLRYAFLFLLPPTFMYIAVVAAQLNRVGMDAYAHLPLTSLLLDAAIVYQSYLIMAFFWGLALGIAAVFSSAKNSSGSEP